MQIVESGSVAPPRERFVKNAWYAAMWGDDLAPGVLVPQTIVGETLAFYRREDGSPVALFDRCAHRFAPLTHGKVLPNDRVQCGYHGLEYAPSGACVHNPFGNGAIPPTAIVRSYPVVEKHRMIWVWPGEGTPDHDAIPDFSMIGEAQPQHVAKLDFIRIAASYRLVVDNLLDPSHTSYLHAGSLGNAEMVASAKNTVEHTDRQVVVDWSSTDVPAPNLLAVMLPKSFDKDHVDKWTHIRWTPASNILLETGMCPTGTARSSGTGYYGLHILTPENDRSTLYFFTSVRWNPLTEPAVDAGIRESLTTGRREVFLTQDTPIIEAQQQRIDQAGTTLRPALVSIDAGPVRYGKILDAMIAGEDGATA
jgi:phenylpropionate dioxygenase-like ring-hydroxylating dioxygenase large terminal subunit